MSRLCQSVCPKDSYPEAGARKYRPLAAQSRNLLAIRGSNRGRSPRKVKMMNPGFLEWLDGQERIPGSAWNAVRTLAKGAVAQLVR